MRRINIFQLKKTIITCKTDTKAYQVKKFFNSEINLLLFKLIYLILNLSLKKLTLI